MSKTCKLCGERSDQEVCDDCQEEERVATIDQARRWREEDKRTAENRERMTHYLGRPHD